MGFMRPIAEHMTVYEVETNSHTETVPVDVMVASDFGASGRPKKDAILKYCEGSRVTGSIKKVRGWFSRLSAPGYMDSTDWQGPYKTEKEALDAVKEQHSVDDEGDDTSEW
jgi:hypothetical protein